uniref:Uncharacterized protein n=1 Tax=Trypanosoma congolense (strain IL3000) TaxID=1068625 RepID=G0UQC2_TRYCI|nr:conserved hypothetical protein [Trypanosoma congolense IL3000]
MVVFFFSSFCGTNCLYYIFRFSMVRVCGRWGAGLGITAVTVTQLLDQIKAVTRNVSLIKVLISFFIFVILKRILLLLLNFSFVYLTFFCRYHRVMLRHTASVFVRLPKARRPRERPWEIFNTRDFGFSEGSQNYSMWFLSASTCLVLLLFEVYQQTQRILARGDTCPACEAAREHYKKRVENKENELLEGRRVSRQV